MATIEIVNIDDVFPLFDEYGNNLASRDYSTKENQKYVEKLARSMSAKGIPDEMVTLVRDGGIYRIKAGNSRIEAMRKLGTKKFPAIVEDEGTKQAIIETIVRTNVKKKYSEKEEAQFITQLQAFGDDDYVSSVADIKPEESKHIRRAVEAVKDAAQDMSLLRLIAIGENADDPEAVEALTNCAEKDYLLVAKEIETRHAREYAENELLGALKARNIPVVDNADGYALVTTVNRAEMLPECLPEQTVAVYYQAGFYLLMKPSSDKDNSEHKTIIQEAKEATIAARVGQTLEEMEVWLAEALKDGKPLRTITAQAEKEAMASYPIKQFKEAHGMHALIAGQIEVARWFIETSRKINSHILDYADELVPTECDRYLSTVDIFVRDGYATTESEQHLYAEIKELGNE